VHSFRSARDQRVSFEASLTRGRAWKTSRPPGGFRELHSAGNDPCGLPCGPPMMRRLHSTHPEMGHGLRYRPTMFTKQVSGPVDSLDPPSWPRRRSRSSELEERPAHGPNPRFCALQALRSPDPYPATESDVHPVADIHFVGGFPTADAPVLHGWLVENDEDVLGRNTCGRQIPNDRLVQASFGGCRSARKRGDPEPSDCRY
jgi:hypothetical protein